MRGDWVYRGEEVDSEGGVLGTQVASYVSLQRNSGAYPLSPGTEVAVILYDSYDYFKSATQRFNTGAWLGKEARPEGPRPTILAVEGHYFLVPNAWTLGSNWAVSARIVICDQNLQSGQVDLPALYNMPTAAPGTMISAYANGWGNLVERVDWNAFATGNEQQRWKFGLRWRGRRRLQPHECLALLIESAGPAVGSTSLTCTPQFRTLVHDTNV